MRSNIIITLVLLFLTSQAVGQTTFHVTNGNDSGLGSLRQAIIDANTNPGADIVVFDSNFTVNLVSEITITAPLTITGNGMDVTTIDGGSVTRIFNAFTTASLVTISGVTIQNGASLGGGGGIFTSTGVTLILNSSKFINNISQDRGGAIYSSGYLTLNNTTIKDNKAGYNITNSTFLGDFSGGGVYVTDALTLQGDLIFDGNMAAANGGALWKNFVGSFTTTGLTSIIVNRNVAVNGFGGGIYSGADFSLINAMISNNTSSGQAGGIYAERASLALENTTVSGNKAGYKADGTLSGASSVAGGIRVDNTLTLAGTLLFENNLASGAGGAIWKNNGGPLIATAVSKLTINRNSSGATGGGIHTGIAITGDNWEITNNQSAGNGGGINTTSGVAVTLSNSTIAGNTAKASGGGIYTQGNLSLSGVRMLNNAATGSDGGGVYGGTTAPLKLVDSEVSKNSAKGNGGGIAANASLTLENIKAFENKAGVNGGGVYAPDTLILKGSIQVARDTAAKRGGGIYKGSQKLFDVASLDSLIVTNCAANGTFVDGSGKGDCDGGGGIYTEATVDFYGIKQLVVRNCYAVKEGGGIYLNNTSNTPVQLKVANATIANCAAGHDGGGIENYGVQKCTIFVKNSSILNNSSMRYGGGIGAGSSLVLEGKVVLDSNIAVNNGGAISHWDSTLNVANLDTLIITNNTLTAAASKGGGIWTVAPFDLTQASYVSISNNSAKGSGGGIYCYWNDNSGSSAVARRSPLRLKNATFSNNSAPSGGGVYVGDMLSIQENVLFENNTASTSGGAIYANSSLQAGLSNISFLGNTASTNGGAIYSAGTTITGTLDGVTFTRNTAGNSGGAIYAASSGSLSISNSYFIENAANSIAASTGGGALYYNNTGMSVTLTGSEFSGNTTAKDGGAVSATITGSTLNQLAINNSQFSNNSAAGNGGAINFSNAKTLTIITGATLDGNTAGTHGGSVYAFGSLALRNTTVSNSKAGYKSGVYAGTYYGGGVYANDTLKLQGTVTFERDTASYSGGAFYKNTSTRPLITSTLDTLIISGNAAKLSTGGGIYTASSLNLSTSRKVNITNNTAGQSGGGIYANLALTLKDAVISDNRAGWVFATDQYAGTYHGGGVYANDTLELRGKMLIRNNTTSGTGGGIYKTSTGSRPFITSTLDTLTITNNAARNGTGGGIYTATDLNLSTANQILIGNNTSSQNGGGIYANLALTLRNAVVSGNRAGWIFSTGQYSATAYNGGGIYANNALELQGRIVFDSDTTSGFGAGIYKTATGNFTASALDSLVITNSTAMTGAGAALYTGAALDLSSLKKGYIFNNKAATDGAGIYANAQLMVANTILRKNTAGNNGGAIYKSTTGELSLSKSTLAENSAKLGGGIYTMVAATANLNTIANSTFSQNVATAGGGGAIHSSNTGTLGALTVSFSTFNGNTSTSGGNAIHFANAGSKTLYGNIIYGNGTGIEVQNPPTVVANSSYNIVRGATLVGVGNQNIAAGNGAKIFASTTGDIALLADNGGPTTTLNPATGGYAQNLIPASSSSWGLSADQRSLPRPVGCGYDAGSVEIQTPDAPATVVLKTGATNVCKNSLLNPDSLIVSTSNIKDTTYYSDRLYMQAIPTLPIVIATQSQIYVKFTTINNCEIYDSLAINVGTKPTVTLVSPAAVCAPSTVDIVGTATGADSYKYYADNAGSVGAELSSTLFTGVQTTSYWVIGTSAIGCVGDAVQGTVTINAKPIITVTSPATVCAPSTIDIAGTATGAATYRYYSDAACTIEWGTTVFSGEQTTNYWVKGTSTQGCTSDAAQGTVTINAKPVITVTSPMTVCTPSTVDIAGTAIGATTYKYYSNAACTIELGSTIFTGAQTTNYWVKGASAQGCISDAVLGTVTINAKPVITATSPAAVCAPSTVDVAGTATGATTYRYYSDNACTTELGSTVINSIGTTNYWVVGTSAEGCVSDPIQGTVIINALPTPTITGANTVWSVSSQSYTTEAGMASYAWTVTGGVITSGQGTPSITVNWGTSSSGTVSVNVTNASGCTSAAPVSLNVVIQQSGLELTLSDSELLEGGPSVTATICLSEGAVAPVGGLTVNLTTTSTVATSEYSIFGTAAISLPTAITIPAGERCVSFTIIALADNVLEGTETLAITASTGGFTPNEKSIDIIDKTPGDVVVVANGDASEPSAHSSFTIKFKADGVTCKQNVLVTYSLSGTAVEGTDYASLTPHTIAILAGNHSVQLPITVLNNFIVEGTRMVQITIESANPI